MQCSAVIFSAKKKKKSLITDPKLNPIQLLLKVASAIQWEIQSSPHTAVSHLFCCPCLFPLRGEKQLAGIYALFCKTLGQQAENKEEVVKLK